MQQIGVIGCIGDAFGGVEISGSELRMIDSEEAARRLREKLDRQSPIYRLTAMDYEFLPIVSGAIGGVNHRSHYPRDVARRGFFNVFVSGFGALRKMFSSSNRVY